jgi:hypothetical protein
MADASTPTTAARARRFQSSLAPRPFLAIFAMVHRYR